MNQKILNFDWIPNAPTQVTLGYDLDFYRLFSYIRSKTSTSYFFESLALPRHQDRYHVLGFDPIVTFVGESERLKIFGDPFAIERITSIKNNASEVIIKDVEPYHLLSQSFPRRMESLTHEGGLIGYFSHEAVNYFEKSLHLPEHKDFHLFQLGLYLDGLIYDMETSTLSYYTFGTSREHFVHEAIEASKDHLIPNRLISAFFRGQSSSKEEFVKNVDSTREKIIDGYSLQAEVGFKSVFDIRGDKLAIYNRLRQVNPSPYMYFLKFHDLELMGASPEILVANHQGVISTTPTAGTIRRGVDDADDRKLARKLLSDEKEIAEHNMLVDLYRNDLARVSQPGSVRVMDFMFLIRFSHVQHIVSLITSTLSHEKNSFDLLASILPGGVTTGAPKIETIKIIHATEKEPRGPYGGAVGRFSFNGDCDFCLPIRSIFCVGDNCYTQTSAGVVYDSVPEREYEEVTRKLAAMLCTLQDLGANA